MGLMAESKSRRKLSKDPNNTKWTRDTSTFGHKILRAQGWEPGQFLGATDAGHSKLHTAANASHIRVSIKDDMKGLGFNKAKADEVTGLNVFSDLLSRLNGKSEEDVEGDRRARLVMKTNVYVEQKWGAMRFVRGGLLVGDTMKEEKSSGESPAAPETDVKPETKDELSKERRRKKRKLADADEQVAEADSKAQKKRRKEERRARKASAESAPDSTEDTNQSGDAKAKKKSKRGKSSPGDDVDAGQDRSGSTDGDSQKTARKTKSKDKKPDVAVDEDTVTAAKRSKKDKKGKSKRENVDTEAAESSTSPSTEQEQIVGSATATGASTPTGSGTGTSTPKGGRNFARSRFIAAKRQAMLDAKSLNQIFMIKT